MRNPFLPVWRWLTLPDPTPGLSAKKVARLLIKSLMFAFVAVALQVILRALGLKFVDTWWGTAIIVVGLYIPFARFLAVDMATPPARGRAGVKAGTNSKYQKTDRRKYAGVKKGGPRF